MSKIRRLLFTLALLAITAITASVALADDAVPKTTAATNSASTTTTNTAPKPAGKQADVASKTVKFTAVSKTSDLYKTALDAHALDAAAKQVDKDGAFKGTVAKIFEPRGGAMAIINFDANYRSALTALLRKENFDKFPALTNLADKEVVVTGKFIDYQGRAEIVLTNAAQIKLVEQ
jgi:hypothetical protein